MTITRRAAFASMFTLPLAALPASPTAAEMDERARAAMNLGAQLAVLREEMDAVKVHVGPHALDDEQYRNAAEVVARGGHCGNVPERAKCYRCRGGGPASEPEIMES